MKVKKNILHLFLLILEKEKQEVVSLAIFRQQIIITAAEGEWNSTHRRKFLVQRQTLTRSHRLLNLFSQR